MKSGKASIFSAILASSCCIIPLILLVLSLIGLGSLGLSGVSTTVGNLKWFLMPIAILGLGYSYFKFFKEKKECESCACEMVGKKTNLILLATSTILVATFLIFSVYPYLFAKDKSLTTNLPTSDLKQTHLKIEGMTCVTCTITAKKALESVEGVEKVWVGLKEKKAIVDYEPNLVQEAKLIEAINKVGYKAQIEKTIKERI